MRNPREELVLVMCFCLAAGLACAGDYDNAYLEATDGQVINTRYFVKDSTRFEIDYRFVETNGQQQILFGNYYGCDNNRCVAYINGSGNFKSGLWSAPASAAISANTTNLQKPAKLDRRIIVVDAKNAKIQSCYSTTGNAIATITSSISVSETPADRPLVLFGLATDVEGTTFSTAFISRARVYSMRIYEDDTLVHEYYPRKVGGSVGMWDMVDKVLLTDAANKNTPFTIGGMGVINRESPFVVAPHDTILYTNETTVLAAFAPGAVRYRWTKNGTVIEGGEDGNLQVVWENKSVSDHYLVTPIFTPEGDTTEIEGEGASVAVTFSSEVRDTSAYLEATDGQVINTGYHVKATTRIEADYRFVETNAQQILFGNYLQCTNNRCAAYINGSFKFKGGLWSTGGTALSSNTGNLRNPITFDRRKIVVDASAGKIQNCDSETGAVLTSVSTSLIDVSNTEAEMPLAIFGVADNAECTSYSSAFTSRVRIYSLRIYEDDTLVHEYYPRKVGDSIGLWDKIEDRLLTDALASATPFKIGGMGMLNGASLFVVVPSDVKLVKDETAVLSAFAPGAVSYRWTKNGIAVEGGEDGQLTVVGVNKRTSDVFSVTPLFLVDTPSGDMREVVGGESASTVVSYVGGLTIVIR